ncbi:MAG TPA: hypothetical protein VGH20_01035 [Myxococcales bacterium]
MPLPAESLPEPPEGLATLPLDPEVSEPVVDPLLPEVPMLPLEPELPDVPMLPDVPLWPVLPDVPMLPLEPELPLVPVLPLPVLPDCANAGTASAKTPIKIALPILFPPWSLTLRPAGNIAIRATA